MSKTKHHPNQMLGIIGHTKTKDKEQKKEFRFYFDKPKTGLFTQRYIKYLLDYNPKTGIFRWLNPIGRVKKGDLAGNFHHSGYSFIKIHTKLYAAHRLAWLYMYGSWPENEIDHKDLNKSNNRIKNLRKSTRSQNVHNKSISTRNNSGYKGVYFENDSKKYVAQIGINNRQIKIGRFKTAIEASIAYNEQAKILHGKFARLQ